MDDIIDDLDILLTSGRLQGSTNRALIKSILQPMMGDIPKAIRAAQQLVLSTPEYHSTNLPRTLNNARPSNAYATRHKTPYKAVIVLMLRGGCDSFNMIVPLGQCATGVDAYGEYAAAAGHFNDLWPYWMDKSESVCNCKGVVALDVPREKEDVSIIDNSIMWFYFIKFFNFLERKRT